MFTRYKIGVVMSLTGDRFQQLLTALPGTKAWAMLRDMAVVMSGDQLDSTIPTLDRFLRVLKALPGEKPGAYLMDLAGIMSEDQLARVIAELV